MYREEVCGATADQRDKEVWDEGFGLLLPLKPLSWFEEGPCGARSDVAAGRDAAEEFLLEGRLFLGLECRLLRLDDSAGAVDGGSSPKMRARASLYSCSRCLRDLGGFAPWEPELSPEDCLELP